MQGETTNNRRINSEIHASLRRLDDAINIVNTTLSEKMMDLENMTRNEFTQFHSYIDSHIMGGDLCFFQTLWAGNVEVDGGLNVEGDTTFKGNMTITGNLTVTGKVRANEFESTT